MYNTIAVKIFVKWFNRMETAEGKTLKEIEANEQ